MAEVSDILKGVVEQNPLNIKTAMGDLMMDKIKDVVADRKMEIANQFLNADGPDDFEEDEVVGDEEAEDIEAEADEIGDEGDQPEEEAGEPDENT